MARPEHIVHSWRGPGVLDGHSEASPPTGPWHSTNDGGSHDVLPEQHSASQHTRSELRRSARLCRRRGGLRLSWHRQHRHRGAMQHLPRCRSKQRQVDGTAASDVPPGGGRCSGIRDPSQTGREPAPIGQPRRYTRSTRTNSHSAGDTGAGRAVDVRRGTAACAAAPRTSPSMCFEPNGPLFGGDVRQPLISTVRFLTSGTGITGISISSTPSLKDATAFSAFTCSGIPIRR
jgi:hypothetical protein